MNKIFAIDSPLMKIMKWLADMVRIQLLWTIYTLLGAVFLGLFPSTAAMYSVLRDYIYKGEKDFLQKKFKVAYKESFKTANIIGYISLGIHICLILYFRMSLNIGENFAFIFVGLAYVLLIGYSIVSLYLFPIYVHFDLSVREIFKHALIIAIASPLTTISLIAVVAVFALTFVRWMILVPIITIAIVSYIIMYFTLMGFKKIKKNGGQSNE